MKRIKDELLLKRIMISDGAWGTFLTAKGLVPGECPELWNISHEHSVLEIAKSYIDAGSDMIETNSFGASGLKLKHFGLGSRTGEINEAAARISREASGKEKHVIGPMGPTGKILMMGDTTEEELYSAFREQAIALEAGGADACCIETMSALDEAVIAIKAAKENTTLEIIATFTFEKKADRWRTMMGVSPDQMAKGLIEAGADIIGTNCGNGIDEMIELLSELGKASGDTPLIVQPNAGKPFVLDGKITYPDSPEYMASKVPALIEAGARIIGGCCGTTPAHIRAIREAALRCSNT
jgi:5-methyltetrahydrofolate--homocysteine methyltransferase